MRKTNKSALHLINEVAGKSRLYILFLLLVQMVLGISSVFYALLLRGLIDGAVAHDSKKMLTVKNELKKLKLRLELLLRNYNGDILI